MRNTQQYTWKKRVCLLELSSALGGAMSRGQCCGFHGNCFTGGLDLCLSRVLSVCPEFQCPKEGLLPPNPVLIELQRLWSEAAEQADPAPARNGSPASAACGSWWLLLMSTSENACSIGGLLVFLGCASSSRCKPALSELGSFMVGAQCKPPLLCSRWCFSFQFWGGWKQQALGLAQDSCSHGKCSLHREKVIII